MKLEQLLACADVLGQMSKNFAAMPSQNTEALQAGLQLALAHSLMVEYASHISKGIESYDAMEKTVLGVIEIAPEKAVVLSVLLAKPLK